MIFSSLRCCVRPGAKLHYPRGDRSGSEYMARCDSGIAGYFPAFVDVRILASAGVRASRPSLGAIRPARVR